MKCCQSAEAMLPLYESRIAILTYDPCSLKLSNYSGYGYKWTHTNYSIFHTIELSSLFGS